MNPLHPKGCRVCLRSAIYIVQFALDEQCIQVGPPGSVRVKSVTTTWSQPKKSFFSRSAESKWVCMGTSWGESGCSETGEDPLYSFLVMCVIVWVWCHSEGLGLCSQLSRLSSAFAHFLKRVCQIS